METPAGLGGSKLSALSQLLKPLFDLLKHLAVTTAARKFNKKSKRGLAGDESLAHTRGTVNITVSRPNTEDKQRSYGKRRASRQHIKKEVVVEKWKTRILEAAEYLYGIISHASGDPAEDECVGFMGYLKGKVV